MGDYLYGMFKCESGIHRLIRLSPFDNQNRRHTSFARVRFIPKPLLKLTNNNSENISIKDLKIDTYRSSGPGGQHVNTTDSAVRITHLPTGIIAASQIQRSQHANRKHAMELLIAKLYTRELESKAMDCQKEYESLEENAWGQHFRTYILHPYTMLKDHRCGYETNNVHSILSGSDCHEFKHLLEAQIIASCAASEEEE